MTKTRSVLKALAPEDIKMKMLGGEPVTSVETRAPGNDELIGGVKISCQDGWFAVRPSGTEAICVYGKLQGRGTFGKSSERRG